MTTRQRSQDLEVAQVAKDLDLKITEELENLNNAAEEINTMELLLGEARGRFQEALKENTGKLNELERKLGSCVEKSKQYYEARQVASELQLETGAAAVKFERANSQLIAAKEMVDIAEQGALKDKNIFDHSWQEMLNQATMKVNAAENQKNASEAEHLETANRYEEAEQNVKRLYRSLRRNINKSKPYFEAKSEFKLMLDAHKSKVDVLALNVKHAKEKYKAALSNLEMISSYIHQERQNPLERRESGVGAESNYDHPESPSSPGSPLSPGFPTSPIAPMSPSEITLEDLAIFDKESYCPLEKEYDGPKLLLRARSCPRRSVSMSEEDNVVEDPLSILGPAHSTDHLDNMSDTLSYVSSEATSDQERLERDSTLDGPLQDAQFLEVNPSDRGATSTADPNDPVTPVTEIQEVTLEIPGEEDHTPSATPEELSPTPQDEETLTPEVDADEETLVSDV